MSLLVGLEMFRTSVPEKIYHDVYAEFKSLVKDHGNFAKLAILPTGKQVIVRVIPGPLHDMSLYYSIPPDTIGKLGFRLEGSRAKFSSVLYGFTDSLKDFKIYGTQPSGNIYEVIGRNKHREIINLKASLSTLKSIVELAPDYFEE